MNLILVRDCRGGVWGRPKLGAVLLAAAAAAVHLCTIQLRSAPALGLRVAPGFQVTLFADENLANDIYAMTLDSRGNVVVTGQGYIRTLFDENQDGVAESAIDFAYTPTGGMGLCFVGNDLLFVGDGALWRFRDADADYQADGEPERLLSLAWGEHGGHAVRHGPDGAWYVMGGNDSKFDPSQIRLSMVPRGKTEGGALLRLTPNSRGAEVVAHGFRNPYDFDFTAEGDLLTYDSDAEADYFLPWYTPTRVYHIAPGGHHGWRLEGHRRSWARRPYYGDTVEFLEDLDRGSPTGVAYYNHLQFPPHYRGGLFTLDWTFGRVHFLPLEPAGSSYEAVSEVFLESIGSHGFAPTDVAVASDGSLLVSSGGRKTRGAIYRVRFVGDRSLSVLATNWLETSLTQIEAVLRAPQPLEAWSRAWWMPMAERIGPEAFTLVATDRQALPEQRVRAIEILTEIHDGLLPATAATCALANSPLVRGRTAWSLGLHPSENFATLLVTLARDGASSVRCSALEAMHRQAADLGVVAIQQALAVNLAHPDKRVRQAGALLATDLPEPAWKALWNQQQAGLPQARLTALLALLWRTGLSQINTTAVETALTVLNQTRVPELRSQALRLIMLGFGDYHLEKPSVEVYTAYETAFPLASHRTLTARIQKSLVSSLPSGDATVDFEAARLLAMIEADDPSVPGKITAFFNERSAPSSDFHYLTVFSRLKTVSVTNHTGKIADTVLSLDRKLAGLQRRPKQNWTIRLMEVVQVLLRNDPPLAEAMLRHPEFVRSGHLGLVTLLGSGRYAAAARLYLKAVQGTPNFQWSEELIDLLSTLPPEETHRLFRAQLSNITLRDRLLIEMASKPQLEDRDKFVEGLASVRPETVRASMSALLHLPNESGTKTPIAALRLLRSLIKAPQEQTTRAQALALLGRVSGQKFTVRENAADLAASYEPIFNWFAQRYPGILRQLETDDQENPAYWEQLYKSVRWAGGDSERGEILYRDRGCQSCHSGARPIGPDLGGATQRFSPEDLFNAIIFPSRDIAPAYRMTTFNMSNGETYTGLVAFESADGVIIQTGMALTARLAEQEIVNRKPSTTSFMPAGLLAGLKPADCADLYAYLKTLQPGR
jgi:putative membrane-bound dehydrogenase-like protein